MLQNNKITFLAVLISEVFIKQILVYVGLRNKKKIMIQKVQIVNMFRD